MEARQVKARATPSRVLTGSTGYRTLTKACSANSNHVLGVDLGGGKGKKTALATLRVDGADRDRRRHRAAHGRRAVLRPDAARHHPRLRRRDAAVHRRAADLPPCLRCAVPVCPGQELASIRRWSRCARWRPRRARRRVPAARQPRHPPRQAVDHAVHAAHDRGLPGVQRRHRRARGAGPGDRPARRARRAPGARARRSLHAEREPDRGLSEGDAGRARPRDAVQEAPARARDARAHPRGRCRPSCASAPASGASAASRATTCSRR